MSKNSKAWRVSFDEQGRDGYVIYEEGGKKLSFYWAFGAGNVVASIAVGDEAEWRADYPEFADRREEIIARIAEESIRRRSPTSRAEMDETGRFLNFISGAEAAPASPYSTPPLPSGATPAQKQADAAAMVWRLNKVKRRMSLIILVLTFIVGGVFLAGRQAFSIKTTGTPIGASARAGDFIATPISRLEPYVPSLDRNHGRDVYSIGLLFHSARDDGFRRYVDVAKGKSGSVFGVVKITGVAGDLVWFDAPETSVIDAGAGRILSADEAMRAPAPPRPSGADALAALSTAERRLEGLLAEPGESGTPAEIRGEAEIYNAAFLRAAPNRDALRLEGGDFLAVYWAKRYRDGALFAARVSPAGDIVWRMETALGRLDEALPDPSRPAFVGARPRIEGKVSEPLLVVIDAASGRAQTHSLLVE